MPEIDLSSLPVSKDYSKPIEPEEGIGLGDYGKAALAGGYGVIGGVASGVDYLADTDDDSALKDVRQWAERGAKDTISAMTPEARDALNAGFLPGEAKSIWSPGVSVTQSLGLKLANASPSLVASIIPGGIVAKAAQGVGLAAGAAGLAGTAAGGAVNATMMGGQVYDDIENSILDAKDDYLKKNSPLYSYLRGEHDGKPGISETLAKKVLVEAAADNKPLLAAAVGFATDQFGATAMVARRVVGEAGEGVFKGIRKGAVEEAGNEAAQNAVQEGLTQQGQIEAGAQASFDWKKFAEQVVQGGTIGGIMGGAVGGATRLGGKDRSEGASDRVPEDAGDPAAPSIEPVVAEAAGSRPTPRDKAKGALKVADEALGDAEQERAVDPAIAAAVRDPTDVIPRNNDAPSFTSGNEFEADPDFEPTPAVPQEAAQPAIPGPGQAPAVSELPVPPPETPAAVGPSEATETAIENSPPVEGGQTIDLSTLATTDEAEAPVEQPNLPPVPAGHVRMFHGGSMPTEGETRWTNPSYQYARDYRTSDKPNDVFYVDVPEDHPSLKRVIPEEDLPYVGGKQRYLNSELPADIAKGMRPVAPRVLRAAEPSAKKERTGNLTVAEAQRIARGEGDATTLSHDEADWNRQKDRIAVKRLAEAFVTEKGDNAPQWARDALDALAKPRAGNGAAAKAAREQYLAARRALSEATQARQETGEARRETAHEVRNRQREERHEQAADGARQVVEVAEPSADARLAKPAAVRAYASDLVMRAKAAGVSLNTASADPHVLHIKSAAEIAAGKGGLDTVHSFLSEDFLLRHGEGEYIASRRSVEAAKTAQSYDEAERSVGQVKEGADASEAYEAADLGAAAEYARPEVQGSEEGQGSDRDQGVSYAEPVPAPVQERAPDREVGSQPGVVGQNKAGTFKTETRRRINRPASPSPAQAEAGNYRMGHKRVLGFDTTIETAKGGTRSGKDASGREWSVKMPADYGYLRGTKGVDNDHLDVYLGPNASKEGPVYVVNQNNLDGSFDEHKAMVGFRSKEEAVRAYKAGFSDGKGKERIGSIIEMGPEEFRQWAKDEPKGPAVVPGTTRRVQPENHPMPLRAKRQETFTAEEEANYRELAALLGTAPEVAEGAPVVTSSRSGATAPILTTSRLGQYLESVDHIQAGGTAAQVNPFIARRLNKLVADVPVHVVSEEGMRSLTEDLAGQGGFPEKVAGYYDPVTHTIVVADTYTSDAALSHLMLHEGLHAAFMQTIERNPAAKRVIRSLMDDVRAYLGSKAADQYGMLNEHEFVSEAFSSRDFQELLASVPVPPNKYARLPVGNIWQHFITSVRKFLGLAGAQMSALDASLRIGAALTDLRTAQGQPSTARTPYAAPAALGSDTIRNALSDVRSATQGSVTLGVLRARTLDQIRQFSTLRNLFPDGAGGDHADNMVRKVQRWQAYTNEKRRVADGYVQEFERLKRTDPKVAQQFAILANDVRMADLNLLKGKPTQEQMQAANRHVYGENDKSDKAGAWQSKALHGELQRRFSAMPEAAQDLFVRSAKYYKATQTEKATAFANGIIEQLAPDIDGARREELVKRTLAGTLNDEDRKAIGNNTLFDALKSAPEFKSQRGMYFPLDRHGDYIVRTRDRVTDTMGGKEVEPGVVAFTGKDKEARKAAEAFARKTDLTVNRIAKWYYDPQTGEPLKAADADPSSRVEYRVSVQTKGFYSFDTKGQAARFVREARANKMHDAVEDWQRIEDAESRGDLTYSQMSALVRSVDARDDLSPAQRQILKTTMSQAAIRLMSGNRIQHRSLPAKMVQGASEDFSRNMLAYASAESNFLGKLQYMPGIREDMQAMEAQVRNFNADKSQVRHMVFEELKARVNANDVGMKGPGKFVRTLLTATMLGKLASPAYSVINATQPIMTSLPILGAEHGNVRSAAELAAAYRDIGAFRSYGEGVANSYKAARNVFETSIDTSDPVASVRRRLSQVKDAGGLRRMLDDLQERGALGDASQFELASSITEGAGPVGRTIAKADRIFRQMPAAVEAVNRIGTAVAAYRLARAKGLSEDAAKSYAYDTVTKTQFDYSPSNSAPMFNSPMLRPLLQFKKYAQAMTDMYATAFYRAFKGESKAERKVALKQFGNLLAIHAVMAGSFGIPGLEVIKAGTILAAAFGLGSGWKDQERRIRRALEASIGKTWSDVVAEGVVGNAIGIDLSNRLSAADMWIYGEPRKYTKSEITAWIGQTILGASGGTLLDLREGVRAAEDLDFLGAASKIVPVKVLGDTAKAISGYSDEKMSLSEAAVKSLGFQPKRIADQQEARADKAADTAKSFEKRDELRRKFLDAGTASGRARIKIQILEYNRSAEKNRRLSIPSLEKRWAEDRAAGLR